MIPGLTAAALESRITAWRDPLADAVLTDSCVVRRDGAITRDSRGNPVATDETEVDVPCLLRTGGLSASEQAVADRVQSSTGYAVDMPFGTDVVASDRIAIGARSFAIVGVVREDGIGVFTTAVVEERV